MGLREDILAKAAAANLPSEEVDVPEWGLTVLVRRMSGTELADYESQQYEISESTDKLPEAEKRKARWRLGRALVVAHSARDADGNLIFARDDLEALAATDGTALDRVYAVGARLSKLRETDKEDAKKNSS